MGNVAVITQRVEEGGVFLRVKHHKASDGTANSEGLDQVAFRGAV